MKKNFHSFTNTCGKIFFYTSSVIISVSCIWFSLIWIVENSNSILLYHSALSSGWLSGSLHAITGSDHLASLLPIILAQRWKSGLLYGAIWGFGHGLTSFLLGSAACGMKSMMFESVSSSTTVFLRKYRYLSDVVTATTILVIGIMGFYESSAEQKEDKEVDTSNDDTAVIVKNASCENLSKSNSMMDHIEESYLSYSPNDSGKSKITSDNIGSDISVIVSSKGSSKKKNISSKYTASFYDSVKFISVCLHGAALGLSLDGLPSLTPAIILEQRQTLVFLATYWLSTTIIMALAACIVAEASYYFSSQHQFHSSRHISSSTRKGTNITLDIEAYPTDNGRSTNLESEIEYEKMHYENRLARVASLAACLIGTGYLMLSLTRLYLQYFYSSASHHLDGTWVQFWMVALAVQSFHQEHSFLPVMNDGTGSDVSRASNDDNRFVSSLLTTPPLKITPLIQQGDSASAVDISLAMISTVSILVALLYGLGGGKLLFGDRRRQIGSHRYHQ